MRRLIVFARVPARGRVKTRLAAVVGDDAALAVHRRLLAQTMATAAAAGVESLELCIAGEDEAGECATLARARGAALATQQGETLGERMREALARALAEGFVPVLIGCDVPSLQAADLLGAFDALRDRDAVFAPTEDGGYALVGCRDRVPDVFDGIRWGGPEVMADTRARLSAAGARWAELRTQWDVDEAGDLARWNASCGDSQGQRRKLLTSGLGIAVALAAGVPGRTEAVEQPAGLTPFSRMPAGAPPEHPWREQQVSGVAPNRAEIVDDGGARLLRLESSGSASAWTHPLSRDPGPRALAWRWRVDGFPQASRLGDRATDDFAARVYLLFDYPLDKLPFGARLALGVARAFHDDALPAASICYLLYQGDDPGEPVESPYTPRVKMIVARAKARDGVWYREERDLRRDFAACFGAEHGPGMPPVTAVVVGADSDQGGGRFRTWFGDLSVR